jgi:hypothetical protein
MTKLHNAFNIKVRAVNIDDLTMNRIAMAFMPELLIMKKFMIGEPVDVTDGVLAHEYQDITFYPVDEIRQKAGYEKFHKTFSASIYKKKGNKSVRQTSDEYGVEEDDKSFLTDYQKWNKIVQDGYNLKSKNKQRIRLAMNTTLSIGQTKPEACIEWLKASYNYWAIHYNLNEFSPNP